jgi:hypothetical protein
MTVVEIEVVAEACSSRVLQWTPRRSCSSGRPANLRPTRLSHEVAVGVELEARMTQQPTLDGRGFVGGIVVDDQMERESGTWW